MSDKEATIRVSEVGDDRFSGSRYLRLDGLRREEADAIIRMVAGLERISVKNGRLEWQSVYVPALGPTDDPEMLPFWRVYDGRPTGVQLEMFDSESVTEFSSPHFIIQHLCGYYYTPENYRKEVAKLESYGFECLRSRRGDDGKFWEHWLLPGLWRAKGELKAAIDGINPKEKTDKAVSFLCRNASFGSLSVGVQRAAMTLDDG